MLGTGATRALRTSTALTFSLWALHRGRRPRSAWRASQGPGQTQAPGSALPVQPGRTSMPPSSGAPSVQQGSMRPTQRRVNRAQTVPSPAGGGSRPNARRMPVGSCASTAHRHAPMLSRMAWTTAQPRAWKASLRWTASASDARGSMRPRVRLGIYWSRVESTATPPVCRAPMRPCHSTMQGGLAEVTNPACHARGSALRATLQSRLHGWATGSTYGSAPRRVLGACLTYSLYDRGLIKGT